MCPHNEVAALCRRVLAPLPAEVFSDVSPEFERVFGSFRRLCRRYRGNTLGLFETARTYSGALQRRYLRAAESLVESGFDVHAAAELSCFLKGEKVNVGPKWPKPRMIFPRTPEFNLVLASRLKKFEHWLWSRLDGRAVRSCFPTARGRLVAKGLNPSQRARLIVSKFSGIRNCVVVEVDGKAFEAHVGPSQLRCEHSVYRAAFPRDALLSRCLSEQLVLSGRLPCGARFSRSGGRASGDFNTGMGNSLVMLGCVGAMLHDYDEFDVLADGDNCLIFVPERSLGRLLEEVPVRSVACCGQELEISTPVRVVEEVRFGQSAPVWFPDGWRMVREPFKVMSGAASSYRWLREPKFRREYLAGVARCEYSVSRAVPLLQAYAIELYRAAAFRGSVREHPFSEYMYIGASLRWEPEDTPVHPLTRESFYKAFGVSPAEQVRLERGLRCPSPDTFVCCSGFVSMEDAPPGYAEAWYQGQL